MKILIFGVSNVGKSVTGKLLADRIGYRFYDLDEEVMRRLSVSIEKFVHTGTLKQRDQIRCRIITSILQENENLVLAITPLSYMSDLRDSLYADDIVAFQLTDTCENIFDRLVFSDENDVVYKDDDYKNKHKYHYIREIKADQEWYGSVYSGIPDFPMKGMNPEKVVQSIISKYSLLGKD